MDSLLKGTVHYFFHISAVQVRMGVSVYNWFLGSCYFRPQWLTSISNLQIPDYVELRQHSHLAPGHSAQGPLGINANTPLFQVPTLEFGHCAGARVQSQDLIMHQSISPAPSPPPPPPQATAGHLPTLSVPGVGHLQILHCSGGRAFAKPPGHFRAFDTHTVSYQNITTQRVLLEKKQIGSSVKDRNKL